MKTRLMLVIILITISSTTITTTTATTIENEGCLIGTRRVNGSANNSSFHCKCQKNPRYNEIYYHCKDNKEGQNASVCIMEGRWWDPSLKDGVTLPCPFGYCSCMETRLDPESWYCSFDPSHQCSKRRKGQSSESGSRSLSSVIASSSDERTLLR